jgi:hypothetical protein
MMGGFIYSPAELSLWAVNKDGLIGHEDVVASDLANVFNVIEAIASEAASQGLVAPAS